MGTRLINTFLVIIFILTSCNKDNNETKSTTLSNITFTGCTNSLKSTGNDSTSISIESNGANSVTITHKATEFCCSAEKVDVDLKILGDTLVIYEIDKGPMSYCFCEHDISFNVESLNYGNYKVKIIESENSYERDTIMFEFNHSSNTNYSFENK